MRVAISSAAARMLDPGRKAGLIGCLRLKHVAVRDHRHERGDEAVRGGANERALPRLGLRHRSQGASRCRPRHGERRSLLRKLSFYSPLHAKAISACPGSKLRGGLHGGTRQYTAAFPLITPVFLETARFFTPH